MSYVQTRRGRGFGAYDQVGNWEWEYYPPPYDFLAPPDAAVIPVPVLYAGEFGSGLSGCGCGCGGSGACGGGDHSHGVGLFDTMDVTQWGAGEWIAALVGGYLFMSVVGDLGKGARTVRKTVGRRKSAQRRKEQLQKELASL